MQLKLVLFASLALSAQVPENPGTYYYLREYLQLTPEQYTRIQSNNSAYGEWVLEKAKRIKTVQDEIAVESKRETIVPGALGARYAEVEVIRRQLIERRSALYAENRKVLNEPQLAKLKAFDEAFKLQEILGTLRFVHLLESESRCFAYSIPGESAYIDFCGGSVPYVSLP